MLQDEYKRVWRDNRIKLVEAEEPDRDTKKKQIQWYLKCDRQNKQEIEYRCAIGHLVRSTGDHHSTGSGAAHRTGQSADDLLPMISGLYRTWQSRKPPERANGTIYSWRGIEPNLSVYVVIGQHLFLIEESKEASGEKKKLPIQGEGVAKHDTLTTGLCSRRKHLFYRDNQEQQNHIFTGTRQEERTRADQEEYR